jgi:hypothetical protein
VPARKDQRTSCAAALPPGLEGNEAVNGDELIIWGWLAFFANAIDVTLIYRIYTGKMGEAVRAEHMVTVRWCRGIRNYVILTIALNTLFAPIGFLASLYGAVNVRRKRNAERQRAASENP